MGNTKIRRLLKKEQKWIDKNAPNHKHIFSKHFIVSIKKPSMGNNLEPVVWYYNVMKCEYCDSFVSIPKEGSNSGFINEITDEYRYLPIIYFVSNKNTLGFDKNMKKE